MGNVWQSLPMLENRDGILYFDGQSVPELVKEFGSPLYLYSERRIRDNYRRLVSVYRTHYPNFAAYYAVKANSNPAIVRILAEEGAGADCCCPGDIEIASLAGVAPEKMLYTGAYLSPEHLQFALERGVPTNFDSIELLDFLTPENTPEFISFRINPMRGSSGEEGLVLAGKEAKFGISPSQIEQAYATALAKGVRRFGVHMMTGTNILDQEYLQEMVATLMDLIGPVAQKLGISFEWIDIGGSLGIPYRPEQSALDLEELAREVVTTFRDKVRQYGMGEPLLVHEPGRYLVGDAGILVTSVSSVKQGEIKFVGVDAGMNTLLRPALYGSYHHVVCASNLDPVATEPAHVVGPVCENTDVLAKTRPLPSDVRSGDILAFMDTGAYGFGMSSQYNTWPRAAEVLVGKERVMVIRERETFEDLVRGTVMPGEARDG